VKNRTLVDLYVRVRVHLESGQRYVITINEE
jgi:hypothetical protein